MDAWGGGEDFLSEGLRRRRAVHRTGIFIMGVTKTLRQRNLGFSLKFYVYGGRGVTFLTKTMICSFDIFEGTL